MKKRYLLFYFLLLTCVHASAQDTSTTCKFSYSANLTACKEEVSNHEKFATLSWDFSKIGVKADEIKIEVLPVKDCFNELEALRFKNPIVINIDKTNLKNTTDLFHREMAAKCFKWRVIVKSENCIETAPWQYHSFIENK